MMWRQEEEKEAMGDEEGKMKRIHSLGSETTTHFGSGPWSVFLDVRMNNHQMLWQPSF